MNAFLRWLDRFPLHWLTLLTVWLAVSPVLPEPHLVEKLRMLSQGTLVRPLDLFDLLFHIIPVLLLTTRLWWQFHARVGTPATGANDLPPPT